MTRPELRVFLQGWFCGCGRPEAACASLRDILALHPLYDDNGGLDRLIPYGGLQLLVLYTLDHFDLTEHGSGIGGGWLTDKGREVLERLNAEAAEDGYATLIAQSCMHGYAIDNELDDCPECSLLNR